MKSGEAKYSYPPILMDRETMARSICVSVDVLDRMRALGCPAIAVPGTGGNKRGAKVVFDPVDVVAWLKSNSGAVEREQMTMQAAKAKADKLFN